MSTSLAQFFLHPRMNFKNGIFVVISPRNAALIRDDDNEILQVVAEFNGVLRTFNPNEIFDAVKVVHINVQSPVPVEENSFG